MPPMDCKNRGTHHTSFILTLTSRKTTSTALNHSLHPRASNKTLSTTCVSPHVFICSIQGKFVHLSSMHINLWIPCCLLTIILLLFFQMATLNFNCILLMLADQDSIPQNTLQSQDGLNLGGICFCPKW